MKTNFFLAVFVIWTVVNANAQTTFEKVFGGNMANDGGYSVVQSSDSGYVFTGYWCYGVSPCNDHMFLIKTDYRGNLLWIKLFKGYEALYSIGRSVVNTLDGGFAVAGYTTLPNQDHPHIYLVKTNSNGDTLWTKLYGHQFYSCYGFSLKRTHDNKLIMTGFCDGITASPIFLKVGANDGQLMSRKSFNFGTNKHAIAISINEVTGGYALAGFVSESNGSSNFDIFLIKTNNYGDSLWTRIYSGNYDDHGYCVEKTSDNGLIIAGATTSFGAGGYDAYVIKTDSNGVVQWTKTYGGLDNDFANYIFATSDGGYIITGSTESLSVGMYDVYLIKIDSLGNQQWYKTFGGVNADYAYCVQQTFDGGYILVGMRGDNIYLIKTDRNGDVVNIEEINASSLIPKIKICPNPFSYYTTIELSTELIDATLIIYDITGKEIKQTNNISGNKITLSRNYLPSGLYLMRIIQNNEIIASEKLMIAE